MKLQTLGEIIDAHTGEGELYSRLPDNKVRCYACAHRCVIPEGKRGICKVRFNKNGKLMVPWGYVAGLQVDPVEKKPFFHVLPGTDVLTFGMLGCDFHCSFCQNWVSSQALRDPASGVVPQDININTIIEIAKRYNASGIASSYNEPLITSEWAVAIFKEAKKIGLKTLYVSNGNATPEVLEYLRPHLDAYKIDLKTMNDKNYRKLGGVLKNVLDTVEMTYKMGFWVEVVTLIVPEFNDSDDELREIARFIASISTDIPWHVTAFHRDYKMFDRENTPPQRLITAAEIGKEEGLKFVYAGNLPGYVGNFENTYCPTCSALLVKRFAFSILKKRITESGTCPDCGEKIPGIWN